MTNGARSERKQWYDIASVMVNIRIDHECEGGIEKSPEKTDSRITDWRHEARRAVLPEYMYADFLYLISSNISPKNHKLKQKYSRLETLLRPR